MLRWHVPYWGCRAAHPRLIWSAHTPDHVCADRSAFVKALTCSCASFTTGSVYAATIEHPCNSELALSTVTAAPRAATAQATANSTASLSATTSPPSSPTSSSTAFTNSSYCGGGDQCSISRGSTE